MINIPSDRLGADCPGKARLPSVGIVHVGVLTLASVLLVAGCGVQTDPSRQQPPAQQSEAGGVSAPRTQAAPSQPVPTASSSTQPAPTRAAVSPPAHKTSKDPDGMVHSDTASTRHYVGASLDIAPKQQGHVNLYYVQVEDSVGVDANAAAREIQLVLDDPRGWSSVDGQTFQLVSDRNRADFVLSIASPATTDQKCLPLNTEGTWSCRVGKTVNLNSDRWLYATPTWGSQSLAGYRGYLINHEVGHFIGHGHVGCPGPGQLAPVMMQQSIDVGACVPNSWPNPDAAH